MMNPVANLISRADDRLFYRLNKGLKHEEHAEAVSKIFKRQIIFTSACIVVGVVTMVGFAAAQMPIALIVVLVATPVFILIFTGIADYSEKRERLARQRLNNMRSIIEATNHFKDLLNEGWFPFYNFDLSNTYAKFMKRIGIISRRSFWRIKSINFAIHGRQFGCIGRIKRKIFNEGRWEEVRMRLLNDLPSDLMLQELDK